MIDPRPAADGALYPARYTRHPTSQGEDCYPCVFGAGPLARGDGGPLWALSPAGAPHRPEQGGAGRVRIYRGKV